MATHLSFIILNQNIFFKNHSFILIKTFHTVEEAMDIKRREWRCLPGKCDGVKVRIL